MQGNDALSRQDFDKAVAFYTLSLENDPDYARAYNNRGVARIEDGHPYEAIQDYNQAILINPEYHDALFNRAYAYEEVGKYDQALEDINYLKNTFPDSAFVHFYKGLILTKLRDYPSGIASFKTSLLLDSMNMEARVNLATLYFFTDRLDSARQWLRSTLALNPNDANAYNTLSQIYLSEEDYQNALITINRALDIVPQEPYFLNNRGQVYLKMKDYEGALKDINKSILLDPSNAWAYRNKGLYHLAQGEFEEAVRLLKEAEKRNQFIDDLYSYLGEAYLGANQKDLACESWKKGVELNEERSGKMIIKNCQ